MPAQRLQPYIDLLEAFIESKMSAADFEKAYLLLFKNDSTSWSPQEFSVLDELFGDVDAFCADPDLCDEGDLDEAGLREKCATALEKLIRGQ